MIDGVALHESSSWRQQATKILEAAGFATYDPTKIIRETEKYVAHPNEVYINDTFNLSRAHIMLVNMDLPQVIKSQDAPFFTIGEMFLAHKAGKPIITFGNTFKGRNAYEAIVTKNFPTLLEAVNYIVRLYS